MAEQYKEYVCGLTEPSLKRAKEELNENPDDRMSSVENFRKLIKERAPHMTCSMEADFLLRFLRVAKFSQLGALERLEKYLDLFNSMPEWLRDIDMMDPKIQAFLDIGYMVPLGFDDEGRAVTLYDIGSFDPKSKDYDKISMMRAAFGLAVHGSQNENAIVNGLTGLADLTRFGLKHQTIFSLDDAKKQGKMMNGGWPARWKGFYYYNHGPVFETVFNMMAPFMKKKIKDRLHFMGNNLEAIYDKKIPMRLLPIEYLPDDYKGPNNGHLKDLIKKMKDEVSKPEVVAKIKYETSDAFRLDESKRPKNDVPLQSFRKLNVD